MAGQGEPGGGEAVDDGAGIYTSISDSLHWGESKTHKYKYKFRLNGMKENINLCSYTPYNPPYLALLLLTQ